MTQTKKEEMHHAFGYTVCTEFLEVSVTLAGALIHFRQFFGVFQLETGYFHQPL